MQITDVIQDTHEDPILNEQVPLCGENAAQVRELVNYGTFRAGTSVFYSSTTASPTLRTQVNAPITIQLVRKVKQFLDGQYAKPITRQLDASPDFNTSPVKPGYVAIGHTDLSGDLFDLPGFIPMEKYASGKPEEAEIGAAENLRFVLSAFLKPLASAGSTTLNGMRTTNGTNVDVYPILVVAKDAWGVVPLAGTERQIIRVLNPGTISASDPLGQRGFVSWKMWHAAVILNQNWCSRVEVGSTA